MLSGTNIKKLFCVIFRFCHSHFIIDFCYFFFSFPIVPNVFVDCLKIAIGFMWIFISNN